MHIWLIKTGENVPIDGKKVRLLRTGVLAEMFSNQNNEVIWWTANFDHFQKKHRFEKNEIVEIKRNYKIILLHSRGYKKNVSLSRIQDHKDAAKNFVKIASDLPKPDVIVASMPTLDLCIESIKFANANKIPILIDIRDLWPDIFIDELLPKFLHGLARVGLYPLFKQIKFILKNATGIISITQPMLDWGLNYAKRPQNRYDNVFPLAYLPPTITDSQLQKATNELETMGITKKDHYQLRICLVGSLTGYKFDLDTVIEVAKRLYQQKKKVQIILAGSGEKLAYYQKSAKETTNVVFLGWINSHQIAALYKISDVGLAPYRNSLTYSLSIPTKAIEYMSSQLAILTCLQGYLDKFIEEQDCGYFYNDADSLYQVILKILDNKSELDRKKNKAFEQYKQKFSGEIVYNEYMEHILKIIKNR